MKNFKKGFTLLELLIVVAIIALLTALVLGYLGSARNKGNDAGIKENLRNANAQAEIFWSTNTAAPSSYTNVCSALTTLGANTLSLFMVAAAKDANLGSNYSDDPSDGGTWNQATCNDSANAWADEAPLNGSTASSPVMWCVDSVGKSQQESTSIGVGTACN